MRRGNRLRGWLIEMRKAVIDIALIGLLLLFSLVLCLIGLSVLSESLDAVGHMVGILIIVGGGAGIILSGLLFIQLFQTYRCPHCAARVWSHSLRRGVIAVTCSYCRQAFAADKYVEKETPRPEEYEELLKAYAESEKLMHLLVTSETKWLSGGIAAGLLLWMAGGYIGRGILILPLIAAVSVVLNSSSQLIKAMIGWVKWRTKRFDVVCPLCASWRVLEWADWGGSQIECQKCGEVVTADRKQDGSRISYLPKTD